MIWFALPSSPETQLWHPASHSSTPPTQARMFDAGMDVCDGVVLRNLGQTAVPVVGAANPLGGKFQHQLSQRTQTTLSQDPHIWGCAAPNAQAVAFAQHSPQAAHASSFLPHTALPLQNTCAHAMASWAPTQSADRARRQRGCGLVTLALSPNRKIVPWHEDTFYVFYQLPRGRSIGWSSKGQGWATNRRSSDWQQQHASICGTC